MATIPVNSLAHAKAGVILTGAAPNINLGLTADSPDFTYDEDGNGSSKTMTAQDAPTDDSHLVRKDYADSLVNWNDAIQTIDKTMVSGDRIIVDSNGGAVVMTVPGGMSVGDVFQVHRQGSEDVTISAADITQAGVSIGTSFVIADGDTTLLVATAAGVVEALSGVPAAPLGGAVTQLWSGNATSGTQTLSAAISLYDMIIIEARTPSDGLKATQTIVNWVTSDVYSVAAGSDGFSQGACNVSKTSDTSVTIVSSGEAMALRKVWGISFRG